MVGEPENIAEGINLTGYLIGYNFTQSMTGYYFTADRFIGSVSAGETTFQAAAEIDTGGQYLVFIPLKNASNQDLVCGLTLIYPKGIAVEVGDNIQNVTNTSRIGPYTWKF